MNSSARTMKKHFGKCQTSFRISGALASSPLTPRKATKDCAPATARAGRGAAAIFAASPSLGGTPRTAKSGRAYFPIAHLDSKNFERVNVVRWLRDHIAAGVRF